jgi:hypothetical protein
MASAIRALWGIVAPIMPTMNQQRLKTAIGLGSEFI